MANNKRLNATITIGGAISGALKSALGQTAGGLNRIGESVRNLSREQKTLAKGIDTFGRMGKNVDGLRQRYAAVTKELERMRRAQERLQSIENARQRNLGRRSELRGQMFDAVAIGAAAGAPLKAAIDFESAMADVNKVVDFDTPDGLERMGKSIREMSKRLPMAANDIAAIFAAGGQSGLAVDELELFAESAVKMGVAFGISAEEAGQMMAEMRSAFRMDQNQVNTLADQMNLLANTTAASEAKIASVVQRVGPLGEVAGLAAAEIAALGATLVGMGVQEEIAATGIQNFMLAMVQGEAATKAQRQAMEALGLDAKALAKGMQEDANATVISVLEAVKKLPKERQASVMTQLFGKESIKAIAPLLNAMDQLVDNLEKVGDEKRFAGAVDKEYAARAKTTANQLILLKNAVVDAGIALGSILLPAVNAVARRLGPVIGSITELAERFPNATKWIVGGATALVGLRIAGLAAGYAWTFFVGGALKAAAVFARLAPLISLAGKAVLFLGRALIMNPIGLAITGIATAAFLIYKYWGPIKEFAAKLWGGVQSVVGGVWEWFKSTMGWTPLGLIANNWGAISGFMSSLWDGVKSTIGGAWETFTRIIGWNPLDLVTARWEPVKQYFFGLWDDIKAAFASAFKWITDKLDWASDKVHAVKAGVGGAWDTAKGWFSFGGSDDTPADAATAGAGDPNPAAKWETTNNTSNYTDNTQVTINVTQQPGENSDAFAKRVMADIERQRQVRERSRQYDGATP